MCCGSSVESNGRGRADQRPPPTLIVGLGNPILGDDGIGWAVVETVEQCLARPDVTVAYLSVGGLSLMEHLISYERVILVDALLTGEGNYGDIYCLPLDKLPDSSARHTTSAHDVSLLTALRLGRQLGAQLPDEIVVVGIEIEGTFEFSQTLSPVAAEAVAPAAQLVLDVLSGAFDTSECVLAPISGGLSHDLS